MRPKKAVKEAQLNVLRTYVADLRDASSEELERNAIRLGEETLARLTAAASYLRSQLVDKPWRDV